MFVCICNAVRDREIREHAEQGVTTLDELRLRTGCSDCCGQCAEEAESILESVHAGRSERSPQPDRMPEPRQAPTLPIFTVQPA